MCKTKVNIALIACSLPYIVSLLFVTVSSPTLLVLTNINFSDIKQTCLHYKEYSTDYGMSQCFLPVTAILNNLFAIALVVTSVILIIICWNIFKANMKKFHFQIEALKNEIGTLQEGNTNLHFENQRLTMKPQVPNVHVQNPHLPRENEMHRNVFVSPNANREILHLSDDVPNYGSVVNHDNAENKATMLRFPSVIND